jgi:hypothetical protein
MKILKWIQRQIYKLPVYDNRADDARRGRFRVLYSEGRRSQPMCFKNAKGYAAIFGGKIIDR